VKAIRNNDPDDVLRLAWPEACRRGVYYQSDFMGVDFARLVGRQAQSVFPVQWHLAWLYKHHGRVGMGRRILDATMGSCLVRSN
jgi:hypothetical protein